MVIIIAGCNINHDYFDGKANDGKPTIASLNRKTASAQHKDGFPPFRFL
jgi:hypothetical protein